MSQQHTPGPWRTIIGDAEPRPAYVTTEQQGPLIAFIYGGENERGNAALIAAAPDLLSACNKLSALANTIFVKMTDGEAAAMENVFAELDSAIAKAEGRE